jgi:hypothetical protein
MKKQSISIRHWIRGRSHKVLGRRKPGLQLLSLFPTSHTASVLLMTYPRFTQEESSAGVPSELVSHLPHSPDMLLLSPSLREVWVIQGRASSVSCQLGGILPAPAPPGPAPTHSLQAILPGQGISSALLTSSCLGGWRHN